MDWNVELAELEALFDSQCGEDARTQNDQVGPQRLGTIGTNCIATEVKVLEGREEGQMEPQ